MISRRKFLTGSAAVVVGAAVGAGIARTKFRPALPKTITTVASTGIRKGDMLYYGGGLGGGKSDFLVMTLPKCRCQVVHIGCEASRNIA